MKRVLTLVLPILLAVFALAACGSDGDDSSGSAESEHGDHPMSGMPSMSMPAGAGQPGGQEIVISDFKYTLPGTFAPGEEVTVRNDDTAEHTVTADTGDLFDVEIEPGATATFTVPGQPGTFAFHCTYHPNMVGTLEVR
ncbi:cupredoxin-like protein [Rhodococcus wratislaviensis]|uniref:Secreted copper binding protein n=1 Tax=Rhodococcus wratislaviensis TaxID=44752 RepID=A0AB38F5E5_RHOWR|nr:cupredoxin domain-containing protein [Rhodococcus wratislaviensis]REE71122.1 cupredoxin-like protein [Rhodococcus wratislaviensis]SPZ34125.1 secreted copper binding protein [Rhodococcus wratislaviensis]